MIISESRQERTKRVVSKAGRALVLYTVAAAVLIAGVSALLSEVLRYEPSTMHYYEVIPEMICPGAETGISFGLEVRRPWLGTVQGFVTLSQWVNADTGKGLAVESYPAEFGGEYGYREQRSNFVRFAPNEPGRWFLKITLETRGSQALRPNLHILSDIESNAVHVLPFSDARCALSSR